MVETRDNMRNHHQSPLPPLNVPSHSFRFPCLNIVDQGLGPRSETDSGLGYRTPDSVGTHSVLLDQNLDQVVNHLLLLWATYVIASTSSYTYTRSGIYDVVGLAIL